jgi:ribonuclease-3
LDPPDPVSGPVRTPDATTPSLEEIIGYPFRQPSLLEQALTHPSLPYETQTRQTDNQRLEFLGDSVLQLILTNELFQLFPTAPEGILTKLRSRLVSRKALSTYAKRIGLGAHLRIGKGEESSGGRDRASSLSDAFEALVGAIYLDAGFEGARPVILHLLEADLREISAEPVEHNPKGQLQELLQAHSNLSPRYSIIREDGPDHAKLFESKVEWKGRLLGTGAGNSKKEAETAAARAALLNPDIQRFIPGDSTDTSTPRQPDSTPVPPPHSHLPQPTEEAQSATDLPAVNNFRNSETQPPEYSQP